ncbi:MAG: N-acetylglucosamine-6-phosphate deacetylase, partial [Ignavibacteriaceae bacterium]|nr:N-acetylglucosamine-6-phosphate deacetylase [Ignavibacteriaceae bacterium]
TTVVKPSDGNAPLKLAHSWTNKDLGGAVMLGVHLEGPFINVNKKGALAVGGIYNSSPEKLDEILLATGDSLKMMTIAPELEGNLDIIKKLKAKNVVPSFAHSDANYEETKKGFEAGINHVTHIFNAMPSFNHRAPSPLSAIFENETITAQIISDGHHLHPSAVKILYKILGPKRCVCITDGMHGIGLPEGKYVYNGREYNSIDGAARYLDGKLLGSTTPLWNIALKFKEFTGSTFEEAINSVSINPATVIGVNNKKGSLEKGKDADVVIIDDDNSIFLTIVEGKICYQKE